jgi:hypothetical protein
MDKTTQERREDLVFKLAITSLVVVLVIVTLLIGLEVYVRWYVNKDFAFLGGFELEALTISMFALIIGMVRTYGRKRIDPL